ncbi:MAG: hypothetical protein J4F37_00430 [Acidobacteria bacterium]|nr:hypothetical protein [Acidobacteriota bacterium]
MSGVNITLLCEDSQTDAFVRRFLRRRNFRGRDIRTLPLPAGNQSGEQWVRERYPTELKALRTRQRAYLLVVTDADVLSTETRRAQLEAACDEKQIPPRDDDDPVLVIVPRRNIETWLTYLGGTEVDEDTTYPRLRRERDCAAPAAELYRMCQEAQRLDEGAPPSLREACDEYGKLQR